MRTVLIKRVAQFLPILAIALWSAPIKAQDGDYIPLAEPYDFLAIKNIKTSTRNILDITGQPVYWTGEGYHTGIQNIEMALFNYKEIPENVVLPESPSFIYEIKDLEGNIVANAEIDLTYTFTRLEFSDKFAQGLISSVPVLRGGEYVSSARISPELFLYEKQVTLADEPGIRVLNVGADVNSTLNPEMTLTSGYPYEPAEFAGERHLHWQVASLDSPTEIIFEKDEVFELKSDTPNIAAFDTMFLPVEGLNPGEYLYTITSDDFVGANNSFKAFVYDVLLPVITLDKSIYTVGESEEAIIKAEMNYSYPYVGESSSSDKPTVTIIAELLNDATDVSYSDEAWANSDMHCLAELKVPLEKVTNEVVDEYEGEVPLKITVKFNDSTKYNTTLLLPFEKDLSGVDDILTDGSNKEIGRYNLQGIRVPADTKGFVIIYYSDGSRRKVFVK